MLAEFVQNGISLDYTNAGETAIAAGDVVAIGTKVGIAGCDIPAGETGAITVEGVFNFPKASGAITQGAAVYWNADDKQASASGDLQCGYCAADAAADDEVVAVKINA